MKAPAAASPSLRPRMPAGTTQACGAVCGSVPWRTRADSSAAVYAAALQGLGLGFTPLWQIRDLVDSGQLELVLTGFESAKLPIHAVWLAARGSVARAKLFTDFAAAYLPFERL